MPAASVFFSDRASGAKTDRPALARTLKRLEPGDELVVAQLDRLGRSLPHLTEVVWGLDDHGIDLRSLERGRLVGRSLMCGR